MSRFRGADGCAHSLRSLLNEGETGGLSKPGPGRRSEREGERERCMYVYIYIYMYVYIYIYPN